MAVLYRKYRPQTFSEVLGQKHIIRTLKNQVAGGQIAHAYLFAGSRGVGKTTLARLLAKAVNCENISDGEPCGKCPNCGAIANGNFLDLVEIDAASNTGVDNIRDLIEHVKFSPASGKYKVFIIDEVHMLSKGAFNALLKTLEEPPAHAIFVLATTEAGKLPATIVSRTQRFDFKRLDTAELAEHLEQLLKKEKFKLDKTIARLIAENAEGSARDALSLLDKVMTLGEGASLDDCQQLLGITDFASCHQLLDLILRAESAAIPKFFEQLTGRGIDFAVFNRDFLEYLRKILIYQVTGGQLAEVAKDREPQIKAQAACSNPQGLIYITRLFLKSYKDLSVSPRAEIPLLLASLEAAQRKPDFGNGSQEAGKSAAPVKQPTVAVSHQREKKDEPAALPPANDNPPTDSASLDEVRAWWPKIIETVKQHNSSVANLLKTAVLEDVENGIIIVGLKFSLHKQHLENHKNQELIRKILTEISGRKLALRGRVVISQSQAGASAKVSLGDVLQVFGGELVE